MYLINILARVCVIAVGLLMLVGELSLFPAESTLNETFGLIVMLFGVYRLVQYLTLRRNDGEDRNS